MLSKATHIASLALMFALWSASHRPLIAETPVAPQANYTTIKVTDMHCATCAKKIAARLYVLPGVVRVHADVEKNLAYVVPQRDKNPSPRAIWEAIEQAGFEPVALSGPGGRFTTKPAQ
jgi:copper chaperone CopZ